MTVSKCLTGEEGIKTDYIVAISLSFYPVQSPAMIESNRLKERYNLSTFSSEQENCSREMEILLNVKIKLAVSFQSFVPITKVSKSNAKCTQLKLN